MHVTSHTRIPTCATFGRRGARTLLCTRHSRILPPSPLVSEAVRVRMCAQQCAHSIAWHIHFSADFHPPQTHPQRARQHSRTWTSSTPPPPKVHRRDRGRTAPVFPQTPTPWRTSPRPSPVPHTRTHIHAQTPMHISAHPPIHPPPTHTHRERGSTRGRGPPQRPLGEKRAGEIRCAQPGPFRRHRLLGGHPVPRAQPEIRAWRGYGGGAVCLGFATAARARTRSTGFWWCGLWMAGECRGRRECACSIRRGAWGDERAASTCVGGRGCSTPAHVPNARNTLGRGGDTTRCGAHTATDRNARWCPSPAHVLSLCTHYYRRGGIRNATWAYRGAEWVSYRPPAPANVPFVHHSHNHGK